MRKTVKIKPAFYMIVICIAVVFAAILSVFLGSTKIPVLEVLQALVSPDGTSHAHLAVLELRIPRTIGDLLVGAALACAGAMMQGVTRNPLADCGLLGINAGASFALALCLGVFSTMDFGWSVLASMAGATVAALLVFGSMRVGRRSFDTGRLVLAGLAVSMLFTSLAQAISLFTNTGQDLAFWSAGGVAGIRMEQLKIVGPILLAGLVWGLLLAKKVAVLSLGEEVAQGLGVPVKRATLQCLAAVLLMAACSVALAGPIAFVGLLVPYIARFWIGPSYETLIPASMVTGALFMVVADLISRVVNAPSETPVGLIFAIIGVPVFVALARKGGRGFE